MQEGQITVLYVINPSYRCVKFYSSCCERRITFNNNDNNLQIVIYFFQIKSPNTSCILDSIFWQMEEKAGTKYAEVPQNEEHTAKDKDQPEGGAVRLQAKMSLINGKNF